MSRGGWIDHEPFADAHPARCGCQPCSRGVIVTAAERGAYVEKLLGPLVEQLELDDDEAAAIRRRLVQAYEKGRTCA